MSLKWRCLITLVGGMVFGQGSVLAIDCEKVFREAGDVRQFQLLGEIVVVGVIHDVRSMDEETLSTLSEDDRWSLAHLSDLTRALGPFLALIEEGTNKMYDFGVSRSESSEEAVQRMATAQMIGRRVRVTGCRIRHEHSGGPSTILIDSLNDVELLE